MTSLGYVHNFCYFYHATDASGNKVYYSLNSGGVTSPQDGPLYMPVMGAAIFLNGSQAYEGDDKSTISFTKDDRTVVTDALLNNPNDKSNKDGNLEMIRLSLYMSGHDQQKDETVILFKPDAAMG